VSLAGAIIGPGIHHAVEASGVPGPQAVEVLCLVAVVLAIATLSYSLIEKPGRNLLRRVFEVRGRAIAEGNPLTQRAPRSAERAEETMSSPRTQRFSAPSAFNSFR
jgi:peptidoglycan/LPS O-acetylase OafA/YrhL